MTDNLAIAMLFSRSATLSKKRCLSTSLFLLCAGYPFELDWRGSAEYRRSLEQADVARAQLEGSAGF
jgi:hypothetical protein